MGQRRNGLSKTPFWTTVSPHDAFSAPLARSELEEAQQRYFSYRAMLAAMLSQNYLVLVFMWGES